MMVHEATLAGALAAEVAVVHLAVAMELGWVRGSWAGLKVAWETLADLAVARVVVAEAMGAEEAMAPEMVMAPQVVDVVAEATEAGQEAAKEAAGRRVVATEVAPAGAAMEVATAAAVRAAAWVAAAKVAARVAVAEMEGPAGAVAAMAVAMAVASTVGVEEALGSAVAQAGGTMGCRRYRRRGMHARGARFAMGCRYPNHRLCTGIQPNQHKPIRSSRRLGHRCSLGSAVGGVVAEAGLAVVMEAVVMVVVAARVVARAAVGMAAARAVVARRATMAEAAHSAATEEALEALAVAAVVAAALVAQVAGRTGAVVRTAMVVETVALVREATAGCSTELRQRMRPDMSTREGESSREC